MDNTILQDTAESLGIEDGQVDAVVSEFLLQLHRHALEYQSSNRDFIGEDLWRHLGSQGIYHLLGFLDFFSEQYRWEPGSASEYLRRLGPRSEWAPYRHQMESWNGAGSDD